MNRFRAADPDGGRRWPAAAGTDRRRATLVREPSTGTKVKASLRFEEDGTLQTIHQMRLVRAFEVTISQVPLEHNLLGQTPYATGKFTHGGVGSLIVDAWPILGRVSRHSG